MLQIRVKQLTLCIAGISWAGGEADDLTAIFDPAAPNRGADDPFNYGDASVTLEAPKFLSRDSTLATYLDVDAAHYAGKAEGGSDLSGYGDFVGSTNITNWDLY